MRHLAKLIAVSATLALISLGCSSQDHIRVTLLGDDSGLTSDSAVTITLYGYDRYLADAPATLISSHEQKIASFPATVTIEVPANPQTLIEKDLDIDQNSLEADDSSYYIHVTIDDGNGNSDLPCGVQYTQDWEKSDWESFQLGEISTLEIWLKQC